MNNNKLLELLTNTNDYISGQSLAEQLGISRQAVWKCITALRDEGYEIDSVTRRGYKLVAMPRFLNEYALRSKLHTQVIGKNLIVLDEVGSTNDYLKVLGAQNCEHGTVVAARLQTAGKGRLGRSWLDKRDSSVPFSFLLTGLDCKIKWPNDIIVGKKKLVGILTEMSAEFDAVEYLITGVGVNVEQTVFPDAIAYKATSLLLETGRHYDKNELLAHILAQLEDDLSGNRYLLSAAALEEYTDLCATVGRSVTFTRGTRRVNGMAVGVNQNGELRVMLSDGTVCGVNAGEVTIQGIY